MGLFDFLKKENEILIDGELPFGWYSHNAKFFEKFEKTIPTYALNSRTGNIDKKISTLKKMIDYYEDFKAKCYSKNECFQKYFQDQWEHCSNSRNVDFEYITPYKEELKNLLDNYDSVKKYEQKRLKNLQGYENAIHELIKTSPGILQKDIYRHFDESIKADIQDLLYNWNKSGKIKREKFGNSYKLFLQK